MIKAVILFPTSSLKFIPLLILLQTGLLATSATFAYDRKKELNTEMLNEWIVEGRIQFKGQRGKESYFFTWTQSYNDTKLELREKNMVGQVIDVHKGKLMEDTASPDYRSDTLDFLNRKKLYDPLAFWLRGLNFNLEEKVSRSKDNRIEKIQSGEWDVNYKGYQPTNRYYFPEKVYVEGDKGELKFEIFRAEVNFVKNWCYSELTLDQSDYEIRNYINSQEFCEQLRLLHADAPNLKDGFFGPDSMMWKLNKYIMPAGFGAGRALLLQVSHPWVTAGIDEHSEVRANPVERAKRTYKYMYTMVYGSVPQALNAANEVHRIHQQVRGNLSYRQSTEEFGAGTEYYANEIEAMIWVQATLWDTLILMYEQLEHKLTLEEKERFYEEAKLFAMMFGIPKEKMPNNWYEFEKYNRYMWRRLEVSPAARDLAHDLFHQKNPFLRGLMIIQENFTKANMPPRIREQYGMDELGFFGNSFYKTTRFTAKVGDRFLLPAFRYNTTYREANARVKGKKSSWWNRLQTRSVFGENSLTN